MTGRAGLVLVLCGLAALFVAPLASAFSTVVLTGETTVVTDNTVYYRVPAKSITPAVRIQLQSRVFLQSSFVVRARACILPDAGWLNTGVEYYIGFGGNYTTDFTLHNDPSAPCDIFLRFVWNGAGRVEFNTTVSSVTVPSVPELPYTRGAPAVIIAATQGSQVTIASFIAQYDKNTVSASQYGNAIGANTISYGISETPTWSADYQDKSIGFPDLFIGRRYFINMKQSGGSPPSGINVTSIVSPRIPQEVPFAANSPKQLLSHYGQVAEFYAFRIADPGSDPLNLTLSYEPGPNYSNSVSVRISGSRYPIDMGNSGLTTTMSTSFSSFALTTCFVDRQNLIFYWSLLPFGLAFNNLTAVYEQYALGDAGRVQFYIQVANNAAPFVYTGSLAPGDVMVGPTSISVGQNYRLLNTASYLDTAVVLQWNHTGNGETRTIPSYNYAAGSFNTQCGVPLESSTFSGLRVPVPICQSFSVNNGDAMTVRNTAGNGTFALVPSVQVSTVGLGINTTINSFEPRQIRGPSDPALYPVVVQLQPWSISSGISLQPRLYLQRAAGCGADTQTILSSWTGNVADGPYAPIKVALFCPSQTIYLRPNGPSVLMETRLISTSASPSINLVTNVGQSISFELSAGQTNVYRFTKPAGSGFRVSVTYNISTAAPSDFMTYMGNCATSISRSEPAVAISPSQFIQETYRGGSGMNIFYMSSAEGYFRISAPSAASVTLRIEHAASSVCSADTALVPSQCVGRISWNLPSLVYSKGNAESSIATLIDNWNNSKPGDFSTSSLCYSRFLDQVCRRYAGVCTAQGPAEGTSICTEDCVAHVELACGSTALAFKICSGLAKCTTRLPVAPISLPSPVAAPQAAAVPTAVSSPPSSSQMPVSGGNPPTDTPVTTGNSPVAQSAPTASGSAPVAASAPQSASSAPQSVSIPTSAEISPFGAPQVQPAPSPAAGASPVSGTSPVPSPASGSPTGAPTSTNVSFAVSTNEYSSVLMLTIVVLVNVVANFMV